jgi:hypothetical protein
MNDRLSNRQYLRGFVAVNLLLAVHSISAAIEIGETVRVRDGVGFREGTVFGKLGSRYRVQYEDGRMPSEELLDESFIVSDAVIEQEQQRERVGQFYQAIGRGLGMALGLAGLFLFALWYTRRHNRQPDAVVDAEIVEDK